MNQILDIAMSLNNIGLVNKNIGNTAKALEFLNQSLDMSQKGL